MTGRDCGKSWSFIPKDDKEPSPPSPTVLGRQVARKRTTTLLAGIRAGEDNLVRLPRCLFKASSGLFGRGGTFKKGTFA